jgi:hypothetical protein
MRQSISVKSELLYDQLGKYHARGQHQIAGCIEDLLPLRTEDYAEIAKQTENWTELLKKWDQQ